MTVRRVLLAAVLLVVGSAVGVGAATPGAVAPQEGTPTVDGPPAMGAQLSAFMAASASQTGGNVENGMWEAAYADASTVEERRTLVRERVGSLDATVGSLQQERRDLRQAYRDGEIDRTTYRARLGTLVGELAAVGQGIQAADRRGRDVGVDVSGLEELRSTASELGGGAVSELARSLAGNHAPPGRSGVFGGPDGADGRGQGNGGPPDGDGSPGSSGGQGPPTDRGQGQGGNASTTETPAPGED